MCYLILLEAKNELCSLQNGMNGLEQLLNELQNYVLLLKNIVHIQQKYESFDETRDKLSVINPT